MLKNFESLGKSNIEGIEILAKQFHTVCMNVKRTKYDMLAPKTAEFETDFAKFMAQITHIEVYTIFFCLQAMMYVAPFLLYVEYSSNLDGHVKIVAILINRTSCRHLWVHASQQ